MKRLSPKGRLQLTKASRGRPTINMETSSHQYVSRRLQVKIPLFGFVFLMKLGSYNYGWLILPENPARKPGGVKYYHHFPTENGGLWRHRAVSKSRPQVLMGEKRRQFTWEYRGDISYWIY